MRNRPCWLPCASARSRSWNSRFRSFNGYSVSWSNSEMRLLSISRMTEWVRRAVRRLWSKLDLRSSGSELAGIAADACRPRHELVVENAVLRHQLNVLRRHVKRPALGPIDRLKLVIGASLLPSWRGVQPDTILRWHRAGFRLFWRCRRPGFAALKDRVDIGKTGGTACPRVWGASSYYHVPRIRTREMGKAA